MWEYFPYYAELLSAFLGEMNRNTIMDYSSLFRECSMRLISNEKLLNSFVMFLFPKTCLYEINCVIKCLELIHSYFEAISKKNKKMPSDFNFNYFYTGIRSIFESNHSYLLIRVIGLLYNYYHILSTDFKRSLDSFIFGKGFDNIFLHWCDYVRQMFYLFLEHRVTTRFKDLDLAADTQSAGWDRSSVSYEVIEKKRQYMNQIKRIFDAEQQILKCR